MMYIEVKYFNLNRFLLLAIGLWPYQRSLFVRLQFVLSYSIVITFIIFQFTIFLTSKYSASLALKILPIASFFIIILLKLTAFFVNIDKVKTLFENVQHNFDKLRDENEIAIIHEYGNKSKRFTTVFTIFAACGLFLIIFLQFWPCIFNVFFPANATQPRRPLLIATEYFVDQERYYYLIQLHTNAAFCVGITVLLGTGTLFTGYFYHICGMFRIASYRVQHTMRTGILQSNRPKNEYLTYKGIISAVDIHRNAMQFTEFFMSSLEPWFMCLAGVGVISGSLNLFGMFQAMFSKHDIEEGMVHSILLCTQYIYMFFSNCNGQIIRDHNNCVFVTVYNVQWYMAPLQIQKMILFILQRGNKVFDINLGGLFVASLEGFNKLLNASISYFTIMYSSR